MNYMTKSGEIMPLQTYREAVEWINGLIPFGIKPGLQRMEVFMEKLGHPERRLKFIHVAGTNGKGSTCAYLERVLRQAGYDTGMFTSPYMEKFTNRLKFNGEDIPEDVLLTLTNRLKPIALEIEESELGSPTMFEVTTALAIAYYGTVSFPDWVVWEAGLGGRLDCTNIVNPVVSVITNVGHDHMDVLGDTLAEIASEKAGIIKPGVPVVTGADQPEVLQVILEKARERRSSAYVLGDQFSFVSKAVKENEQHFDFQGPFRPLKDIAIAMNGRHQMVNATVALMTLEVLRQYSAVLLEDEDVLAGFGATGWPGRLEMVASEPRILLDGAHNPEGAATLAEALTTVYSYRKLNLMVGMLSTKNHLGYLKHILPIADNLILTEPDFRKKMDAAELLRLAETLQRDMNREIPIVVEPDWRKALDLLKDMTEQEDLAVVSGTLYLISDVRSWILYHSDSEKGW
ncbi:folylpolyglutamate synthase [Paenibacillus swuensis]|uniref:Dihydrofolate synthase/folylpolyglutamate synthase n=1 Tax=Paenibacillus swuensis TaxID=1178515 RepID=A0A172TJH7_9BACL|nr:folylpolyglutamate synthase/dihydrofolate synthase family protein [Paenibacillus swuensis]ANE47160.1 folylpolyglutamate synthase [Paenibacillus swuensis]